MPHTITVPIPGGETPAVVFPSRCAGCGGAPVTTSKLAIARLVPGRSGAQRPVTVSLDVPHCAACASATKAVFLAGFIPFALGFLVAGGAAFLFAGWQSLVWGVDEGPTAGPPRTPAALVLAALGGLLGGVAGGFIAELVARAMLLPFFGRALWRAPLLVPSFLTDSDRVAGVTARADPAMTELTLTFDLDEVGSELAAANRVAIDR
jgi:hypothetical protein